MAKVNEGTVRAAVERLQDRGERTSIRNIRFELGGGSPNTILEIWQKISAQMESESIRTIDVPDSVLTAVSAAMREAAVSAKKNTHETIQNLESNQTELNLEIHQLHETIEDQQQDIKQLEIERAEAFAEVTRLKSKYEQLTDSKNEALERLEAQCKDERARADTIAENLANAEKRAAVAEASAEMAKSRADAAEQREQAIRAQLSSHLRGQP